MVPARGQALDDTSNEKLVDGEGQAHDLNRSTESSGDREQGSTAIGYDSHAEGDASTAIGNKAAVRNKSTTYYVDADGNKTTSPDDAAWYADSDGKPTKVPQVFRDADNKTTTTPQYIHTYTETDATTGETVTKTEITTDATKADKNADGSLKYNYQKEDNTDKLYSVKLYQPSSNSIAAGSEVEADGENAVAVGYKSTAQSSAVAIGDNARAEKDTVAIGKEANASAEGGVALGMGSTADRTGGITGWDPKTGKTSAEATAVWKSGNGAISVGGAEGSRQITNVAAGSEDSDAVNLAQLKKAMTHYYSVKTTEETDQAGNNNYLNDGATGNNALAAGVSAMATADNATAVGMNTHANGENSSAYGYNATAAKKDSVAIGSGATAQSEKAISIGAHAIGTNSIALGSYQLLNGDTNPATSAGENSIAIGGHTGSGSTNSIAIGAGSYTNGGNAVTVGGGATGTYAASLGNGSVAGGTQASAVGYNTAATGEQATALGANAKAGRNQAVAIGSSTANGNQAVAIGSWAAAGSDNYGDSGMTAIGQSTAAHGQGTTALGYSSHAGGTSTTAIGSSNASGSNTIAIGGATSSGSSTIAIGQSATSDGGLSIALGSGSNVSGSNSTGVGAGTKASNSGTAVGYNVQAGGSQATAIGFGSNATGANATAIGGGGAWAADSVAIGSGSGTNTNAIAIGKSSGAWGESSIAIGEGTNAWRANSIVLGKNSKSGADKNIQGFDPLTGKASTDSSATWNSTDEAVSFGRAEERDADGNVTKAAITRQLNNVAAGTLDTDAVNVAQLKLATTKINMHYYSVHSTETGDDSNYANDGATGTNALAAGVSASASGAHSVAVGNGATATGTDAIALGTNAKAEGQGALVVGEHNSATGQNAVAFGGGYGKDEKGNTASAVASVAFGENTTAKAEGTVAFGYGTQAGSDRTDNKGKNYGQNAVAFGNGTKALGGRSLAFGENTVADYNDSVAFGNASKALSTGAVAFGSRTRALAQYSTAFGNRTVSAGNYATAFGTDTLAGVKTDASGAMWLTNGTKIDANGNEAYTDGSGNTYAVENFQNVKNGQPSGETHNYVVVKGTDGKTYIQDYHGDIHAVTLTKQADGTIKATASTDIAKGITLVTADPTSTNGYDFVDYDNATAFGESTKAINVNATAFGKNSVASGENSLAFGEGSTASGNNSVAGLGGTASTANSIAFGKDTKANNKDNVVSVAIGENAEASGARSLAIGFGVKDKDDTVLTQTTASGESAVSIGTDTEAAGQHSIAMGSHAEATKDSSLAIGYDTHATEASAVAIGSGTKVNRGYGVAIGLSALAGIDESDPSSSGASTHDGSQTVAVGYYARATATNAAALGAAASANVDGGVALGYRSATTRTAGNKVNGVEQTAYLKPTTVADDKASTWTSTAGAVSVGNVGAKQSITRQITDVAAGSLDTDAVNVAQLKAAGVTVTSKDNSVGVEKTTDPKDSHTNYDLKVATATLTTSNGTVTNTNPKGADGKTDITNAYATGDSVANAINNSGFNLTTSASNGTVSGTSTELINPGETVTLDAGKNIAITQAQNKITVALADDVNAQTVTVTGKDGKDGRIGLTGRDGKDGTVTTIIKTIGKNGTNGKDGKPGVDGTNITRVVYQDGKDGEAGTTTHTVATLDDGLKFKGDTGDVVTRKLNTQLDVTGGQTEKDKLTTLMDKNIGVVSDNEDGKLEILLNKDLTGLNSTTYTTKDGDKTYTTTINGGGLTIKEGDTDQNPISITKNNITMGGQQVHHVQAGTDDTDAVNVSQLKANGVTVTSKDNSVGIEKTTDTTDNHTNYDLKVATATLTTSNGTVSNTNPKGTDGKTDITNSYATGDSVANAINNSGFTLTTSKSAGTVTGTTAELINPGETVTLDAGKNIAITQAQNKITVALADDVNAQTVTVTGKDGKDGQIGLTGRDGKDGTVTTIIKTIGKNGTNGKDGKPGVDGTNITRVVYQDGKAGTTTHTVATLDDGLKYAGDNYVAATDKEAEKNAIIKKLNERLDIKGGATGTLTDNNIGVNAVDGALKVQLAQNIDLTKDGSVTMGNTVVNNDGLKITNNKDDENKNVVINGNNISYGGNQVTNMGSGASSITGEGDNKVYKYDVDTNGANIGDVKKIAGNTSIELTAKGLDFVGNNADVTVHRDLGTKLTIKGEGTKEDTNYSGENLKVIGNTNGTLTIKMDKDIKGNSLTVGEKGEKGSEGQPGKDGVDGRIGVNGKDGSAVVINGKDGSIGLNGTDGTNGLTIRGANGAAGVNGKDGKDGMTRIVYQDAKGGDHTVATLEDGQKYHGDFGDVANVALNHQVNIVGDTSSYNTKNPNSKVDEKSFTADGATANVGVFTTTDKDSGNATLSIKLNKNLTGLDSVTTGTVKTGVHSADDASLTQYDKDGNVIYQKDKDGNFIYEKDTQGNIVKDADGNPVKVISKDKAGNYTTGLDNKTWNNDSYVSGRAATEDQLHQAVSDLIGPGANGGFGLSANGGKVTQALGQTIAINGDGTYKADGTEDKAGNIRTSVENGAIKVSLNKDLNIDSTTMEKDNGDGSKVTNKTTAEGSTITKTDASGKQSSTTINAGSLTVKDGDRTTTIGGGTATIGGVTINGNGESDSTTNKERTSTITGLSNKTFDTNNTKQYENSGRAATEAQLKQVYDKASQHTTVTVNGNPTTDGNLKLDTTNNKDGSKNYAISLNNDITLGDKEKSGKLTVKSQDGTKSITTDGKEGTLTFQDGNHTASMKAAESVKGVDGTTDIERVSVDGHTVATMDDGMKFAGDSGEALKQRLNSTTNIKGGAKGDLSDGNIGVVSDGKDTLNVKLAKDIKGLNSVEAATINATTVNSSTFNAGNTTMDNSGVTIKTGDSGRSITIKDGGISMGGNQIHNVAPGTAPDDAVNVSQLNATNGVVNKLGSRVNKVGAGAAALAALHPLDFDPDDKWDVAAGYGHYKNADAAAVGAFYQPNEDTMFSIGGSFGGGENMVNAGVSVKLGQGNHVSTSRVAMAKEIRDLRENVAKLNDVVNRQSALIDKLTGVNAGTIQDRGNDLFPDVPANHWAYEYVTALHKAGILEGYPDGTFSGDRMMTRYEFAAIVYRAIMAGAASNPALNRDGTLDKLAKEFSSEMKYIRIDTISKDKDGNPDIQRVRVIPQKQEKQ